jgi:hypothetical protein
VIEELKFYTVKFINECLGSNGEVEKIFYFVFTGCLEQSEQRACFTIGLYYFAVLHDMIFNLLWSTG